MKIKIWVFCALACLLLAFPQLHAQDLQIGEFPPVDLIETELQRGVSTTRDVERVLGKPSGSGGYVSIVDRIPRDAWYYHDINTSLIDAKGGVMRMHSHIQVLLVYFSGNRFDGYKWFATSAVARGK